MRWSGRVARQRPAKPYTRVRIPSPPRPRKHFPQTWAIGAAVARFPDTEEVTGSIPVSPTSKTPDSSGVSFFLRRLGRLGPCSSAEEVRHDRQPPQHDYAEEDRSDPDDEGARLAPPGAVGPARSSR